VEKADLMNLVWPDTTVEDVGLARNISLLRKALDDEAGSTSRLSRGADTGLWRSGRGSGAGGRGNDVAGGDRRHRGVGRNRLLAILRAVEILAARAWDRQPGGGPIRIFESRVGPLRLSRAALAAFSHRGPSKSRLSWHN